MEFSLIDFLVGFLLANAIPHFVIGAMDIRFLSLFGFGSKQNIFYSIWNIAWALGLSLYFRGSGWILNNGIFLGVSFIFIAYVFTGRFLYKKWKK
ncbi:MAG: hypothetical protein AB8G05_23375 [Oligoflexales bacterium]